MLMPLLGVVAVQAMPFSPSFPASPPGTGGDSTRNSRASRGHRSKQAGHVSAPNDIWAETGWNKPRAERSDHDQDTDRQTA